MCFRFFVLITILTCHENELKAQLCQGSLGDPLVFTSFGSGMNPGPPLPFAKTNYQYNATQCPNDGFYSIANQTNACFGNSWHTLNTDHTGNGSGYFMLVNASFSPSAFYVDTVDLICSNTTYEFASWLMNVNRPGICGGNSIQPDLTFNIEKTDGSVLKSYSTGKIQPESSPTWKQYGFYFDLPSNVNKIVLRIINNAQGGCGNDLALDDITFRPCGPLVSSSINGTDDTVNFCEGEAKNFTLTSKISAGFNDPYFQWQQSTNGTTWTDIAGANSSDLIRNFPTSASPAKYEYRLAVSKMENKNISICRIKSNQLTVNVHAKPVSSASANGPLCEGNKALLSASGGTQYLWKGINGSTATNATVSIDNSLVAHSGVYYVAVTNDKGCVTNDSVKLEINPRPQAVVDTQSVTICEGTQTVLSATGGSSYQWSPVTGLSSSNISNPMASPVDSTVYNVVVSNSFSCTDTASVQVNVIKLPKADAGPDRFILAGQTTQLAGKVGGTAVDYSWSPGSFMNNSTLLQPKVNPSEDIIYTLKVTSGAGCGETNDSVKVFLYNDIYVPTAFSPNDDGLNDKWNIPALNAFTNYEVSVFNRHGQVVFRSVNGNNLWDGKLKGQPLPTGVYPYLIQIKDIPLLLKGLVLIVR
jgi:gliding motility-associated-like protein